MPLYRCTTPVGSLDDDERRLIANAITEVHCEETGAPATFVHVQFLDSKGDERTPVTLHGGLRAGRDESIRTSIIDRCTTAVAEVGGFDREDISMRTSAAPASWILEGGRVLPEPGEEDAWLSAHA